jgi:hypothetical protein
MSTFPRNILSASSGLGSGDLYSVEDGRLRPEDGDRMYLRNVGIDLLNCAKIQNNAFRSTAGKTSNLTCIKI